MLPQEPAPVKALRDRFPAALKGVYVPGIAPRPGTIPGQVFDLENGIRLIISMDVHPQYQEPVLHISASSFVSGLGLEDILDAIEQVTDISVGRNDIAELTETGIPHFVFPEFTPQAQE